MRRVFSAAGRWLALLIVLALAALPAVFLSDAAAYLPALVLLALGLLSLISLLILRASLRVSAGGGAVQCRRGERARIALTIENRAAVLCPCAAARVYVSDPLGAHSRTRDVRFAIGGRGRVELDLSMELDHVGCFRLGIERVELRGFFGIVRLGVPVGASLEAVVTPRVRALDALRSPDDALTETAAETGITTAGGSDYTGVRAYALGDPMKLIHWKLSAHSREYVTKLRESSRRQEFAVILDLAAPAMERERLLDLGDCLVETALSLIAEASSLDAGFSLLYADRAGAPARAMPAGEEDAAELVRALAPVTPEPDAAFPDAYQLLRQEGQGLNRSGTVAVVTARITDALVEELLLVRSAQRRSPMLFFVVPAEWSRREVERASAPLRRLDGAEIPYLVVSTAENFKARAGGEGAA